MSLDQEMTRYFEYMKPRYTNPTYASSNVGSSLGLLQSPLQRQQPKYRQPEITQEQYNKEPVQRKQPQIKPLLSKHKKSHSQLSNYGTNSLGSLPKLLNERDIYEKQQKKYNIISMQPKQYRETIKRYPKFHLQNMDTNYYKKLQLQNEYQKEFDPGMHLPDRNYNQYTEHISQQANSPEVQVKKNSFRPKMLNNVDELGGML